MKFIYISDASGGTIAINVDHIIAVRSTREVNGVIGNDGTAIICRDGQTFYSTDWKVINVLDEIKKTR